MNVVVVGSSGGGTATLGHTDPVELLSTIHDELQRIRLKEDDAGKVAIRYALYVSLHHGKGMDHVDDSKDTATLYFVDHNATQTYSMLQVQIAYTGTLSQVNNRVKELEKTLIVPAIESSSIQGIICISCDPENTNFAILSAAANIGVPVTGSGGSSLSQAMSKHPHIKLVGNVGGSVATTTYTKAVSYTYSLSKAWSVHYSPLDRPLNQEGDELKQPSLRSVLDACLPSFIAVCCTFQFLTLTGTSITPSFLSLRDDSTVHYLVWQLQNQSLPTICCIVAASTYSPQHKSSALMAASIASMACSKSIITGLLAGRLVSWWVRVCYLYTPLVGTCWKYVYLNQSYLESAVREDFIRLHTAGDSIYHDKYCSGWFCGCYSSYCYLDSQYQSMALHAYECCSYVRSNLSS